MPYLIFILVFILGAGAGSGLNCLVYRLRQGQSWLSGRSRCPGCQHQLNWYDNIPIWSYLWLKAKCRHCQKPISIQYLIVEIITGVLFAVVFAATIGTQTLFNCSIVQLLLLIRNWIFTGILIVIFIYDLKYQLILDKVTIPAMAIALILNMGIYLINPELLNYQIIKLSTFPLISQFLNFLISAVIAGGFFLLQFILSKGKWIGGGDIRLGFLMGLMLGWPDILAALFLAYVIGAFISLGLVLFKKKQMKSEVAFGTFLTVGTFIALLRGEELIGWYFGSL